MYQDFHQQFEDWFVAHRVAPSTNGSIEDVPDFLWHAPENEDGTLDSVAILGEN